MKTKICNGKLCKGKENPLSEFNKHSGHTDGLQSQCKECVKKIKQEEYKNNKKQILVKRKKHYLKNSEKKKAYQKQYRLDNLEIIKIKKQEFSEKNKVQIAKYQKEYLQKNKSHRNKLQKERYSNDIDFKLRINLRNRIYAVLKGNYKSKSTTELLGCTIQELKKYLQSQFLRGMNWSNCGLNGWEIDHIKPCVLFDLSNSKQQKLCFNYRNLQPLWAEDNRSKADKF